MSTATTTRDCRTCWNCCEWGSDVDEYGNISRWALCQLYATEDIDQIAENGCDGYSRETQD